MSGYSHEAAHGPDPFQKCIQQMEDYARPEQARPYNFRPGSIPQLMRAEAGRPCDVYARIGSVLIEDMAAKERGTPIMYDVQVFTQAGQVKSGLVGRLTKHLDQFEQVELLEFRPDGQVVRSYINREYEVQRSGSLSPIEVELLAEQLETLGTIERPL